MGWCMPNRRLSKFSDVTCAMLAEDGVRALVLDIDNTLEPYENPDPTEATLAWFRELGDAGIRFAFVSNNGRARVERFNRALGFPYFYKAKKPFAKNVRRAMQAMGVRPEETALMGDQIFTDVLAAHAAGIRAYLVPPIKDKTDVFTRCKRLLERPILRRYDRRQKKEETQ
ncbi:MAG: YqeG family HAD IIIA-type phosphatase [Clostridia bacterium]|nr:YqeG family HAD IIIA-type phosphatase [Clostridia bacterium]